MNIIKKISVLVLSTVLVPFVHAATATQNINANAQLQASCEVSITNINVGVITPGVGDVNGYSPIFVTCTKGTSYNGKINAGNGTFAQRHMKSSDTGNTDKLLYNLYNSSSGTVPYGDGSTGTVVFSGVGTGARFAHPLHAKISRNQFVTPSVYSDTLIVIVDY